MELKGKVACEISSAEELTLTELMFSGVFKEAKVEELVSLLSCFVWRERLPDAAKPREELDLLFIQLQDTDRRAAEVQLTLFSPTHPRRFGSITVLSDNVAGRYRRREFCAFVQTGYNGGGVCVGKRLQVLRDHGDCSCFRRELDQSDKENGGSSTTAHRSCKIHR